MSRLGNQSINNGNNGNINPYSRNVGGAGSSQGYTYQAYDDDEDDDEDDDTPPQQTNRPIANPISRLRNTSTPNNSRGDSSSSKSGTRQNLNVADNTRVHSHVINDNDNDNNDDAEEEEMLPYEEKYERLKATRILANHEQLVWESERRCESLLQTQLYYEARAAGLLHEKDLSADYTLDVSPLVVPSPQEKDGASKRRVSGQDRRRVSR